MGLEGILSAVDRKAREVSASNEWNIDSTVIFAYVVGERRHVQLALRKNWMVAEHVTYAGYQQDQTIWRRSEERQQWFRHAF